MRYVNYHQRAIVYMFVHQHYATTRRAPTIRTIQRCTGVSINVSRALADLEDLGLLQRNANGQRIPTSQRLHARLAGE